MDRARLIAQFDRLLPPAAPRLPRHDWMRAALAVMVPAMLFAPRFDGRGIVSRVALHRIWAEHRSGRRDHASQLWSLLMLEFWYDWLGNFG